ncbi:MAG: helix-turn-helix transcriptional regulator [Bacilli bacterium]
MKEKTATLNSNINFKLEKLMKEKGFSKNKLCVKAGLRFETVQGYYKGNISRIDLFVISQMCEILECNIQDIIEYIPKNNK